MHAKWERIKYLPNLPLGKNGERVTASLEHIELSRKVASEGMVLLKNDEKILPLKKGAKVALFGIGSADYVKGGGGSGEVYTSYTRNLCDGMEIKETEHKIYVYTDLNDFYRSEANKQYEAGVKIGKTTEPDIPDELLLRAVNFADVAIISICRFSEESFDRKGEPNDGDFYLTIAEQEMVKKVTDNFNKVVVVLNVGGIVDTTWFKDNDKIQAVLLAWQAGIEGGLAEADILCGDVCPSGKLTDTFASCFADYPSSYNFNDSEEYAEYTEDIYVGYRYFETIPNADKKVNYPFGFGLSYTAFDLKCLNAYENDGKIEVKVSVENIGEVAGKEVIQLYYEAPQGKLGKPAKSLSAFCKTRELLPGETQICKLKFRISDMASYDDMGFVKKAAYVLEEGQYKIYVGTSVRQLEEVYVYSQEETAVVLQLISKMTPKKLTKRLLSDGSYFDVETEEYEVQCIDVSNWPQRNDYFYDPIEKDSRGAIPPENCKGGLLDVALGKISLDKFIEFLPTESLIDLTGGRPDFGVSNTKAWGDNQKYHIPAAMTADGPAGVRINHGICIATTAWPCATLLACSWNTDIVEKIGVCGALEMKENNLAIWLTPAMNIHRSPLCGRNFEYYSEDPFISGKMAAAMIKGIQSQRISACAKHFCCNNKETNRMKSDSRVSERALREIYLKPFEISVKEAKPWALMTAYNLVNGVYTSENKELITDILRGEWGYEGLVTTDWSNYAEQYRELLAGNDIRMPHGSGQRVLKAMENGLITREDIVVNVKRILELLLKLD